MKKRDHQPGQKGAPATWALAAPFVPVGVTNRDKRSSFVPDWHSRLGNRDNMGFPTGTNQHFCSSASRRNSGQIALAASELALA